MYAKLVRECSLLPVDELMRRSDVRLGNLTDGITSTAGERAAAIMSLICTTPDRAFATAYHLILNIFTEHEFFWIMDSVDLLENVLRVMLTESWYPAIDVRPYDGHYELLFKPFGRKGAASYIHLTLRDFGVAMFDERLYVLIGTNAANDFLSSPTSRNCVFLTTSKDIVLAQRLYENHKEAFVFAFVATLIFKQADIGRRKILLESICVLISRIYPENSIVDALRKIDMKKFGSSAIEVFKWMESIAIEKCTKKRT